MFLYHRYLNLCISLFVVGVLSCAVSARAEVAQGDGDPTEVVPAELPVGVASGADSSGAPIADIPDLRSDEQGETAENAVATVTADGDFLLPTYLLPGETATVTRTTVVEEEIAEPIAPAEEPLPADVDILAEVQASGVLPEPVAPAKPKAPVNIGSGHAAKAVAAAPIIIEEPAEVAPSRKLLLPLAPVTHVAEVDPTLTPRVRAVAPSAYADQILASLEKGEPLAFLMPRDLKISFYPNESAFSGQSLKWIKAFAVAALNDPRLVVEIRASRINADLQNKRLILVENALRGAGLSTHQILVSHTDRPVDTMLLRAVPRPVSKEVVTEKAPQNLPKNASRVTKW